MSFDPAAVRQRIKTLAKGDPIVGMVTEWAIDMLVKECELAYHQGVGDGVFEGSEILTRALADGDKTASVPAQEKARTDG